MAAIEFITPQDISGTYDATWRSYDCTSIIPGGLTASGALIRFQYDAGTSNDNVGFRRGDSTDTLTGRAYSATAGEWHYVGIGLDPADDTFDYNLNSGSGTPTVEVVGFFNGDDVVFFQNYTVFTPGGGSYADADLSSLTGSDTAIAGIFQIRHARSSPVSMGWRPKGSSDDIYQDFHHQARWKGCVIVGLDGSEVCQFKRESSFGGAAAYCVGYIKSGYTVIDPADDESTATTGSFQDVTLGTSGIAAYAELVHTSNTLGASGAIRNDGDTDISNGPMSPYATALVEATSDVIEQYIANTAQDLFVRGVFDADGGGGGGITARRRVPRGVERGIMRGVAA